jgi:hypothetical protein
MRASRTVLIAAAFLTLAAACGDDDPDTSTSTATTSSSSGATTTTSTTTTTAPATKQPAIWPAAGVVFDTPEKAAQDFVDKALHAGALGEFQQGDSGSGEINVLLDGEGDADPVVRGRLLLRQLGPDNGWFVIGAVNDNATITIPETGAEVPAGPLTVEGKARGFEANVVVSAFAAGDATLQLDQEITNGGALETPEPYTVNLDLSGASPGQVVTLLVRGGTGLETDPGEFSAIPVVIAG